MKTAAKYARILTVSLVMSLTLSSISAPRRSASGITVSASVDSAMLVMGDRTTLNVKIDMPEASARDARIIDFPVIPHGEDYVEWNGVDVVGADSSSVISDGKRTIDYRFTIQVFDPGTVTLPPFAVLGGAGADTAFSNVVTFKVIPVDVDSLETIHPMESVVAPASKWYDYVPDWLLWTLLVVLVLGMGAYFARHLIHRREEIQLEKAKPVPPYELALSRLRTLKSRNLPESGHEKQYYTELVDILRQYLEGRFGINAMEMTSTQIVRALRDDKRTRMTADLVKSVLSIADFVKFAKVRPLPDDNVRAFARAEDFVEQTKPEPEETSTEPNKANEINSQK